MQKAGEFQGYLGAWEGGSARGDPVQFGETGS